MARALNDVPPPQSANNPAHHRLVDAEDIGDLLLGDAPACVAGANGENIGIRQFGTPVGLAARLPSFPHLVGDVLLVRAEEEVGRIAAQRVVAGVTHETVRRDWPMGQLPGEPVDVFLSPPAQVIPAVPVLSRFRPKPWPAGIRTARAVHAIPEGGNRVASSQPVATSGRAGACPWIDWCVRATADWTTFGIVGEHRRLLADATVSRRRVFRAPRRPTYFTLFVASAPEIFQ